MSRAAAAPKIASLADLFAVAYQIEADAVERYNLLADQMETHNNPELVAVFRDLARAEGHPPRRNSPAGRRYRRDCARAADGEMEAGRKPRGGRSRRGALPDDAVARAAARARRRGARAGLLHFDRGDDDGSGDQEDGGGIRRGGGRARQSRASAAEKISTAARIVAAGSPIRRFRRSRRVRSGSASPACAGPLPAPPCLASAAPRPAT